MHEWLRGRAYAFLERATVLPQARIGGTVLMGFGCFAWLATEPGRSPAIGNMALVVSAASPIGIASLLLIPTTYLGSSI